MTKFFPKWELAKLNPVLWDKDVKAWGKSAINTISHDRRVVRRGSERVMTQNLDKASPNTTAVKEQGVLISWVIDDREGYRAKVTTYPDGRTEVEEF